jgi:butyrate kinase
VDLPDSLSSPTNSLRDVVDGKLTLTADELKETIYDPLFTNIFDLIRKQFQLAENKIDTIFITGGLGQSVFVQNKIKKEFGTMVSSTFIPRNGVLSVAHGAIYSLTKKTKDLVVYKKKEDNSEKKSYKVVMGIGNV